jgi:DNA-binding FadR family transcriptional regulator
MVRFPGRIVAILVGNANAAQAAMENHLKGSADWILQLPNTAFGLSA